MPPDTRFTTDLIANPSPLNGLAGRAKLGLPPATKVAIVGFTDKVQRQAPYDDPTWEIWGFNMANRMDFMTDAEGRFRADRWFDLHPMSVQSPEDLAWIACCPVPLYLTEPYPANHMARVYPYDDIHTDFLLRYGLHPIFSSSFAYAVALALHEGYTTIGLYGCDLDWGRERVVEHGNLAFWAGLALGLGCDVRIPLTSAFLRPQPQYGFDYHQEKLAVETRLVRLHYELLKYDAVRERINALNARCDRGEGEIICEELWGHLIVTEDAPIVGQELA